jgi:hypothetical protein
MCQVAKNVKNTRKTGFWLKATRALSHFRTVIFQNGTKKLLKIILRSPFSLTLDTFTSQLRNACLLHPS